MGCLPPDLFVCVCARGVCGSVRGRERREETASCAHAATKHTGSEIWITTANKELDLVS